MLAHLPGAVRFRVDRKLGEGGMGVVYEAFDADRGISVGLKTLNRVSPSALYLFKQEFRSIADIAHPNLITLYELFADSEVWFFTMQLLRGVGLVEYTRQGCRTATFDTSAVRLPDLNLRATALGSSSSETRTLIPGGSAQVAHPHETPPTPLVKGTSPEPRRVREVMLQVAEGIAALHRAGKLHRDIKPSNVLVDKDGHATVLDFGLAIDERAAENHQEIVGTMAYMAPEQALGKTPSAASDWYSVGVMLFQTLCGELPFGGYAREMTVAKLFNDFVAPSMIACDVDPELEQLAVQLLNADPAHRPNESDILAQLANDISATMKLPAGSRREVPFYGRRLEEAELDRALTAMLGGSPAFALVQGAPGVGKSSLVRHYLESRAGDALIFRGRCYEQESVPYKAIDSAIDALCEFLLGLRRKELQELLPADIGHLAQLFPVLDRIEERVPLRTPTHNSSDLRRIRRKAVEALRELLRKIRHRRPPILVIEDLQWGDVDSVLLLSEVFAPPNAPAVLVLCTFRGEYTDRSSCLAELFSMQKANDSVRWFEVAVEPFSPEDSRKFAMQLIGRTPGMAEIAERIAEESGGNPYFALELARYASRRPADTGSAPGLEDVLRNRIAEMPANSRRLLEIIAVHGRPIAQIDAYRAAGLTGRDPTQLISLRFANLVRSSGSGAEDQVEPYHDRIRETTLHDLADDTLRAHHNSLADTLEASGRGEPDSLAFHFEHAGLSAKAGGYYETAGDRATAALAFDRAAAHYRRSLDLLQPSGEREAELRTKLGETLVNSGRCVDAAREFETAAERGAPETKLELQRRAAFHYTSSGRLDEGNELFQRVLGRVGLRIPSSSTATVLSLLSYGFRLRLRGARFEQRESSGTSRITLDRFDAAWSVAAPMGMMNTAQGMSFGKLALLLAMKAGDPERFVYGLQVAAYALVLEGKSGRSQARALIEGARQIVATRTDPRLRGTLLFTEAAVAYVQAEWLQCLRLLEEAEDIFAKRARGVHWELASIRTLQLYTLHTLGRFRELQERSGPFLKEAEELGDLYSCANVETFCEPMARIVADRPDLALRSVQCGLRRWSVRGYHLQNAMAAQALSWLALYEGRGAGNLDYVEQEWRLMQANHLHRFDNLRVVWLDFRFRTALAAANSVTGTPEQRRRGWRIVKESRRALERETTRWGRAGAAVARAAMLEIEGGSAAAAEELLQSAAQYESLDMMGYAWSVRRRAGELLGADRGRELIAASDGWFQSQFVACPNRLTAMHVGGFCVSEGIGERVK